ncbi:MAG: phosphatase PAP2 family protein [Cyanothece sp. SIO2G6]|nr:phosphatase PAP2 family protein [Cyanothece sp. SIO2G6]
MVFLGAILSRLMVVLLCFVWATVGMGCQPPSALALDTGLVAIRGYLPSEQLPDSLVLLPPPPADGTEATALDQITNRQSLKLRGTPRWDLAAKDADLSFPHVAETFACAIAAPITADHTPRLHTLLRRSLIDAGASTGRAKRYYQRSRPFMVNDAPTCSPLAEDYLRQNGSYPSGHTTIGWTWALILSEIVPERGDAILKRGQAFGQSRMVCNVHWQSDVLAGFLMGAAVTARLHANSEFQEDVAAARREMAAVRAKGLKPLRDCEVEAEALATTLW